MKDEQLELSKLPIVPIWNCGEYTPERMRALVSKANYWSKKNGGKFKTFKLDNELFITRVR